MHVSWMCSAVTVALCGTTCAHYHLLLQTANGIDLTRDPQANKHVYTIVFTYPWKSIVQLHRTSPEGIYRPKELAPLGGNVMSLRRDNMLHVNLTRASNNQYTENFIHRHVAQRLGVDSPCAYFWILPPLALAIAATLIGSSKFKLATSCFSLMYAAVSFRRLS